MLPSQAYAGESCHTVPRLSQTFDMWDYQSVPRPPQQFASAICQPAPVIKNTLAGTESQIEEAKRKIVHASNAKNGIITSYAIYRTILCVPSYLIRESCLFNEQKLLNYDNIYTKIHDRILKLGKRKYNIVEKMGKTDEKHKTFL